MTTSQLVSPTYRNAVRGWLFLCLIMVALMVWVGGLTRLTESGLSIVEWDPVMGAIPPLSIKEWNEYFWEYQETPQYQKLNKGMTLEEFQDIFWLEFIHRLIGRLAGAVFFIPLLYFAFRRALNARLGLRLLGIFALGGMQGAVGWIMVASGLVDQPVVSPIKLGLHLLLAFALFALLLWTMLEIGTGQKYKVPAGIRRGMNGLLLLLPIQIFLGALVAGNDAGLTYNTFPLMDGKWIPDGMGLLEPYWHNFFHNVTTVQFMHRLGAWLICGYTLALGFVSLRRIPAESRKIASGMRGLIWIMLLQFAIGILTLLHGVPLPLASLHQMLALLFLGHTLGLRFRME